MTLKERLEAGFEARRDWALRRQRKLPTNQRLFVCACMDERLPVERALGLEEGDAHIFRNAGGLVTDDALRSAMLSCLHGTREIVVVNHTECAAMLTDPDAVHQHLHERGVDPAATDIDPELPELSLDDGAFGKWLKGFNDVDATCARQVEILRNHPFIPDHVTVSGWIWEVETGALRPPHGRLAERVNTTDAMCPE